MLSKATGEMNCTSAIHLGEPSEGDHGVTFWLFFDNRHRQLCWLDFRQSWQAEIGQ